MKRLLSLITAALLAPAAAVDASMITFSGVGNGQVTTYNEAGFTVSVISGAFIGGAGLGNPAPSLSTRSTSTIVVTSTGGIFTFAGFDLSVGPVVGRPSSSADYSYFGYPIGGTAVSGSGQVARDFNFHTVVNTSAPQQLLSYLTITVTGDPDGFLSSLDNINVTAVPLPGTVPEPASALMLGVGIAGATWYARRPSRRMAVA